MSSTQHHRRSRRAMGEINMVPFIDVMLVLLTIFMVTAPLITTGNIDLPSVSNSAGQNNSALILSISAQGQYTLEDKQKGVLANDAALADIVAQVRNLKAKNPEKPVVIAASRKLSYDSVMQVMNALSKAKIKGIGLAVETTD